MTASASTATLAALAPPPAAGDDARLAVAIGPAGEVYAPDGKGAWVRRQRITTADPIAVAARAGGAVVALGDGIVYRLAANGWSAIRLAQQDKAVLGTGTRAVAAVGRQLVALDRLAGGEPAKLGPAAAAPIRLVGAGAAIVIATDRGLFRLDRAPGARLVPIALPPAVVRGASALAGDRWVIVDGGAVELRTGKLVRWPAGAAIEATALAGPDDALVAVARIAGALELWTVRGGALGRAPIELAPGGGPAVAVGLAVDPRGRAVVALRDGRLVVRDGTAWTTASVAVELPDPRPGSPPAVSR